MRNILILILLVIIAGGSFYLYSEKTAQSDSHQLVVGAAYRDLVVELNVIGVLDAAKSHMISSELRGTQGKIIFLIDDGEKVTEGDVLVKFDPLPFQKERELLRAEVASYHAAVQAAEQNVAFEKNQVERELGNAKYNLNVATLDQKKLTEGEGPLQISQLQEEQQKATIELQRHERYYQDLLQLKEQGYNNASEIEAIQEKVTVLKKQYSTATDRYNTYIKHVLPALKESAKAKKLNAEVVIEQIGQGGLHRVGKAQATLNQIKSKLRAKQAALQKAERELVKTEITAPFSGIVIHYETFRDGEKRKPREGDAVFMGQPILYLPDISSMVVKTKAREIDLYKLALGQEGKVKVDAYPDTTFNGELTFIGALATTENAKSGGEKYFQVTFMLLDGDKRLRPGMTCRTSIIAKSLTDVLTVPVQAVFSKGDMNYCYVQDVDSKYEEREVQVGAQNEDIVEIVTGLKKGELVSLIRPGS